MVGEGGSCMASVECAPTAPICGMGACRPCTAGDEAECAKRSLMTPICDTGTHECSGCRKGQAADCPDPAMPTCDANGACRKCVLHTDCTSMVCNSDGTCESTSNILYVDNKNGTCTGLNQGSMADPICDINAAVTMIAGAKTIIRVLPSTAAYGPVAINNISVTIIGAGIKGAGGTAIAGGTNAGVNITGTPTVVLDGLDIKSSTTGGATPATLMIVRSFIHNVGGIGANIVNKCNVTLNRDEIGPGNTGGGVSVSAGTYTITNCFITGNGTGGAGVTLASSATGMFVHNTVTANSTTVGLAGIDCGSMATKAIENSIVWNNTKDPLALPSSQVGTKCVLTFVDINESNAGLGNSMTQPTFVDSPNNNYRLVKGDTNNGACCVDRIDTSSVLDDIDGTLRPVNLKWDIGAHEVK